MLLKALVIVHESTSAVTHVTGSLEVASGRLKAAALWFRGRVIK